MTQLVTHNQNLKQLTLFDLEKLEKRVTEGLAKFVEVGQALGEIQNREGYKLRGCKTMEEYCEKQFGFSLRHGQRLIAAAETVETVKKITGGDAPKNEAATRVLAGIAKDEKVVKRVEAELKKSKKTFATATAEKIQEVVERVTNKHKSVGTDSKLPTAAPTLFIAPDPTKAAQAATRDECPNCHNVPERYFHASNGWTCGSCDQLVALSVAVAVAAIQCAECGKPITPGDDFCAQCGAILE